MNGDNRYAALGVDSDKVFLLDPRNKRFMNGERRFPTFIKHLALNVLHECAILLFVLFLPVWYVAIILPYAIALTGTSATADLINSRIAEGKGTSYYITYQFTANGDVYRNEQGVDYYSYKTLHAMPQLVIKYLPFNPNFVTLVDAQDNGITSLTLPWTLCSGSLSLVFALVALSIVLMIPKQLRGRFQLLDSWKTSEVITGHVIRASGETRSVKNDMYFTLKLRYAFYTPNTDTLITREESAHRDDLLNKSLPESGTPIVVVYLKNPIKYNDVERQVFVL